MNWEYILILLLVLIFFATGLIFLCMARIWLILDGWQEREVAKAKWKDGP